MKNIIIDDFNKLLEAGVQAFVMLGMPGSGKETQSKLLNEAIINCSHKTFVLDTGDLFRDALKTESGLMNKHNRNIIQSLNDSGALQPTANAILMWARAFHMNYTGENHIIMAGGRTPSEALLLEEFLFRQYGIKPHYFFLKVDENVALERMKKRNENNPRPETSSDEALQLRLEEFKNKTYPAIEWVLNEIPPERVCVIEDHGYTPDLIHGVILESLCD